VVNLVDLARAFTPEGDELTLRQRDEEFEIRFNGWQVMSSRGSLSEETLARLVCEGLGSRSAQILIGGLGMGYTVRAVLDAASPDSRVIVSELVPAVIDWNRGPLASLARRPLDDRRVEVRSGSVIDILSVSQHSFHGIILDVDNGPEAVLYQPNRFLYSTEGLELVKGALAIDGILGVWSADRSTSFENTLSDAGFKWRRVAVDARGNDGGPEHTIYLARAGLEAGCVVTDRNASMV
jgi:spermidine synthase